MQKKRDLSKPPLMKTQPLPKSEPPEPPYEVIEFPGQQQYSNTQIGPTNNFKQDGKKQAARKCDLCGSTSAEFRCNMCSQQTFCTSCDQMYHRHPKRQAHIRQRMVVPVGLRMSEPPLPPKGNFFAAPVPPPRRNKNISKGPAPNLRHQGTLKKDGSIIGSLKKLVGGNNSVPTPSKNIRNCSQMKISSLPRPSVFDQQTSSRDSGYLDWDTDSRHRSGSFSTFNGPTFPSLIQAQSMAQLNCPSCNVHRGPMPPWNWNRSQMSLNAYPSPWYGGLAPGNQWHGSMMFPSSYRMPPTDELPRRRSLHSQRHTLRTRRFSSDDDMDSDLSASDDRKSRRASSPVGRAVSPALSRRSRRNAPSDIDEETKSRRNDRRLKSRKGLALSREASPLLSRHSYRRKYEDDTLSTKSVGSRRSVKSISNKSFLRRTQRSSSSDSDDELTSEKDVDEESKPPFAEKKTKPVKRLEDDNWVCEHCTYLNAKSARVCDVCCKSKVAMKKDTEAQAEGKANALSESMKKMEISTPTSIPEGGKKKGKKEDTLKRTVSTGTSPPPQNISTQESTSPGQVNSSSSIKDLDILNSELKKQVKHGIEIVKLLKEAEQYHFSVEDLTTAMSQCGETDPIKWLLENWRKMIDTVATLATHYGREQSENTIGTISPNEACNALHLHNGDLWAATTECIRQRQKKYNQLMARGNFTREDVVTVLTANHGKLEAAYIELNKNQLKPFLMKIWGPPQGLDNDSGDLPVLLKYGKGYIPNTTNYRDIFPANYDHITAWLESMDYADRSYADSYEEHHNTEAHTVNRFYLRNPLPIPRSKNQIRRLQRFNSCDNFKAKNLSQSNILNHSMETLFQQRCGVKKESLYEYRDLHPDSISDLETQNQFIEEYLRNKIEDQNRNYHTDTDTEDDPISDLPTDPPRKLVDFDDQNYYSADNYATINAVNADLVTGASHQMGQHIDLIEATLVNENPRNQSPGQGTSNTSYTSSGVFAEYNLFYNLRALYLLAKCNLVDNIIETRDTTSSNINKIWINIARPFIERQLSRSVTSDKGSIHDNPLPFAKEKIKVSTSRRSCSNSSPGVTDVEPDSFDCSSSFSEKFEVPANNVSGKDKTNVEVPSTNVDSKDVVDFNQINQKDVELRTMIHDKLSPLKPVDFIPSNCILITVPDQILQAIQLKQKPENGNFSGIVTEIEERLEDRRNKVIGADELLDNELNGFQSDKPSVENLEEIIKNDCFLMDARKTDNIDDIAKVEVKMQVTELRLEDDQEHQERMGKLELPIVTNLDTADQGEPNVVLNESRNDDLQTRARRCLSDGLVSTIDQAELAVQLMELKFDRSQSIDAALECSNIYSAIAYLQQECELCAEKFSMKQMLSMLECEHQCCQHCANHFFSVQINERSIDDCVCPFCQKPDLRNLDNETVFNYFSNLDILLKSILKPQTHELFQQKLRDRTLMQNPNFKWCSKCSFGFIDETVHKYLTCPSCKTTSCAKCGKLWQRQHEKKTCVQYEEWLRSQNEPEAEILTFMDDYGITCPQCDTKFILVKGGCMHLTCTRCKYEFCSDCMKPFTMGANCKLSDYCAKLGLHAHHPRNCLFYLRDKEPQELKQFLIENNVDFKLPTTSSQKCTLQVQKENENGLVDLECGDKVTEGGLCKLSKKNYRWNKPSNFKKTNR